MKSFVRARLIYNKLGIDGGVLKHRTAKVSVRVLHSHSLGKSMSSRERCILFQKWTLATFWNLDRSACVHLCVCMRKRENFHFIIILRF